MKKVLIGAALLAVIVGAALFRNRGTENGGSSGLTAEQQRDVDRMRKANNDVPPTKDTVVKPLPQFVQELQKDRPQLLQASDPKALPPLSDVKPRPGEDDESLKLRTRTVQQVSQFETEAHLSPEQSTAIKKLLVDIQIAYVVSINEMHKQYAANRELSPRIGDDTKQLLDGLQSRMDTEFRGILSQEQIDTLYGVPGKKPLGRFSSMRSVISLMTRPFEIDEQAVFSGKKG